MPLPPLHKISPTKRCLLVLDLNGTLLHRRRTNSNVNAHVYARPYLGAFLRYVSHPAAGLDIAVWSSARRENVQTMVERAWTSAEATRDPGLLGRARFPDFVFAREDMLLTDRQFKRAFRHGTFNPDHNVRTTKDLRQLWLHLSQMHDEQLRAQAQEPQSEPASNNLAPRLTELAPYPARVLDPRDLHGPHDTILLDDSTHKARLQPNNHLALPTYGAAELRADANALTTPVDVPQVDEALLAVVGILSEMRSGRADEWTRTGRIWSGPGSQLDPHEMWEQRRKGAIPLTPLDIMSSGTSARTSSPTQSLSSRLSSLPGRPKSSLLPSHEPDPPFISGTRPTVLGETPQWFTCPPLVHAWVDHGRRVLAGLGIAAEHECVRVWPGWRDGKLEIMCRAKDDAPAPRVQGGKSGNAKGQEKAKGETQDGKRRTMAQ
ncbi:hypothetical protein FRC06_008465 [Ceratobasidium sp. 370]|nr:hypothetical protein FRC06_008465 [Ceratobasidium sp. 370]